jgi:hypothetical protein
VAAQLVAREEGLSTMSECVSTLGTMASFVVDFCRENTLAHKPLGKAFAQSTGNLSFGEQILRISELSCLCTW